MAEKSSPSGESKIHPLQASRKWQEFGKPQVNFQCHIICLNRGGEGGIRTPGTLARTPHFECGAIDHSATSPGATARLKPTPQGRRAAYHGRSPPARRPRAPRERNESQNEA